MTKPLNVSVTNRMKFLLLTLLLPVTLYAQAPGVAIVDQSQPGLKKEEQSISDQVERLMEEGKMLSLDQTKASLRTPPPHHLIFPLEIPSTFPLPRL